MKLTRSQVEQLEILERTRATTRRKAVMLVSCRALSPQSLHVMAQKGLVGRGATFQKGRGWLVTYYITLAGRKVLRTREKIAELDASRRAVCHAMFVLRDMRAVQRAFRQRGGTVIQHNAASGYVVRLNGVVATCTWSLRGAYEGWTRLSRKRLLQMRAA